MSIEKYFPSFKPLSADANVFKDLRKEMNRLFEHYDLSTAYGDNFYFGGDSEGLVEPKIDIAESDQGIDITVDMPGVKEKDISIQLEGKSLSIRGERFSEKKEEKKNLKIMERSSGSFTRSIVLPFEPDADSVVADIESGVLTITVPKPAGAEDRIKKIKLGKENNKSENKEKSDQPQVETA